VYLKLGTKNDPDENNPKDVLYDLKRFLDF
jgi:hypothetical protein